jgi:hypothetical protein
MPHAMAVQVTNYLNQADLSHHHPLPREILNYLRLIVCENVVLEQGELD